MVYLGLLVNVVLWHCFSAVGYHHRLVQYKFFRFSQICCLNQVSCKCILIFACLLSTYEGLLVYPKYLRVFYVNILGLQSSQLAQCVLRIYGKFLLRMYFTVRVTLNLFPNLNPCFRTSSTFGSFSVNILLIVQSQFICLPIYYLMLTEQSN